MDIDWVLKVAEAEVAADKLHRHFGDDLGHLEEAVYQTAKGSRRAARSYLDAWERLAMAVLRIIHQDRPDLVVLSRSGQLLVVEPKGTTVEVTLDLLLAVAPRAPFSSWVGAEGLSRGLALELLAEVREIVPGATPLVATPGSWRPWADAEAMRTTLHLLEAALVEMTETAAPSPPQRIMRLFGMDRTELARLFHVKRQAVEQWETRGVPSNRQAKVATILAVGEFLSRKLRAGTLPGVARMRAKAYGDRTMLDLIAADEHEALLAGVRASFDWAATA